MRALFAALCLATAALGDGVPPSEQPVKRHPRPSRPARAVRSAPETVEAPAIDPSSARSDRQVETPLTTPSAKGAAACAVIEPEATPTDPTRASPAACLPASWPDRSCFQRHPLCARDREVSRIAWQYFRRNTQPTGLVNAVDGYPSTTLWDAASSLAAALAARELDLISQKELDDRLSAMLAALVTQKLYRDELPNKAYDSSKNEMSDYGNKPSPQGIGYSALDLVRMASWLDLTACLQPSHRFAAERVLARWNTCRLVKSGELYGAGNDSGQDKSLQEGRTGYEQYAGKAMAGLGFEVPKITRYRNENARAVQVEGVELLADKRGPKEAGAFNYVTTESYALDAMEHGLDDELAPLLRNVLEAQRRRWQRTGAPTATTEDHIDKAPWFLYGTLWTDNVPWAVITDSGEDYSALRVISTKAVVSLATLFPGDPYVAVLMGTIRSAYDREKGWYAGVYEAGYGYDRALTANTNGIVLEAMLYKLYGPLRALCKKCGGGLTLPLGFLDPKAAAEKCLPAAKPK